MFMDEKAQVSVEYLFTVLFALLLVIAVTVITFQLSNLANDAQAKILDNRTNTLQTLAG